MTMLIIFGYALPAMVFFILGWWDELDCTGEVTLEGVLFYLVGAIIPVINWLSLLSVLNHINNRRDFIKFDFVIYRRKK